MLRKSEKELITLLRNNSRETLSELSKKLATPISTLHDRIKALKQKNVRLITLANWRELHMPIQAWIFIKTKKREETQKKLTNSTYVNTLFSIHNGADFACECIFPGFKEYHEYVEELEQQGKVITHAVVEELAKEKAEVLKNS